LRYLEGEVIDGGKIGFPVFTGWRLNANKDGFACADGFGGVRSERYASSFSSGSQNRAEVRFVNGDSAGGEHGNAGRVGIRADDLMPRRGKARSGHQANMAAANHGNAQAVVPRRSTIHRWADKPAPGGDPTFTLEIIASTIAPRLQIDAQRQVTANKSRHAEERLIFRKPSTDWKTAGPTRPSLENPIACVSDELKSVFLPCAFRGFFSHDPGLAHEDIHAPGEENIRDRGLGQRSHTGAKETAGADVFGCDNFLPGISIGA
jgi:hypothetical protein